MDTFFGLLLVFCSLAALASGAYWLSLAFFLIGVFAILTDTST